MHSIVHLAKSSDIEVARQAIGTLANIAEDVETHATISKSGGGGALIALMQHDTQKSTSTSASRMAPWARMVTM